MIHLISRKYLEDTTDSMLFTPIVESVIEAVGSQNVCIWATSKDADVNLGTKNYLLRLFWFGLIKIKKGDTVFVTSTPPFLSLVILIVRLFKQFKVVFQVHDLYPDIMKFISGNYRFIYNCVYPFTYYLYRKVDTFLTISECIKDQIHKNYSVDPLNIIVVQNWTDIENIPFSEKVTSNKVIYIGNIGKAHDYSYFLNYVNSGTVSFEIVIKTDNTSKIKVFRSNQVLANGLKDYILPSFITWNHTRYSKDDLAIFLSDFDYSVVFLGYGFDSILFPCKIYSALALLMPIIFFGPQDSYVCMWIEENNLGFHFSKINQNYHKLNMYRKSIFQFNQMNPDSKKIQAISKIIIE